MTSSNYSKELYNSFFEGPEGFLLGQMDEIESRRPKTPPPRGGGRGGGRGTPGRGGRGAMTGPGRGGGSTRGAMRGRGF